MKGDNFQQFIENKNGANLAPVILELLWHAFNYSAAISQPSGCLS